MSIEDVKPAESIASLKRLTQLFLRPKLFFSDFKMLNRESTYIFTYIAAMYVFMDRMDSQLIKTEALTGGSLEKYDWLIHTWIKYWGFTAIASIFIAFFVWFVYGWWYEMRLKWSGVENESSLLIKQVNAMQICVVAIPVVLITLVQTFIYENYEAAFVAPEIYSGLIILFFLIYSCWVSYVAVRTVFNANRFALFWFFIMPLLFYVGVIAVVVSLLRQV